MGKKLLIVNTYANLWSTGRIAAEIGEIAVKHGWQCYFAYASESNPCSCKEIRINKSVISYIIHTYLFSRILNLKGFGSWIETKYSGYFDPSRLLGRDWGVYSFRVQ